MEVFLGKARIVRVDTSTSPHQLQLSTEGWQSSVSFDAINESLSAFALEPWNGSMRPKATP